MEMRGRNTTEEVVDEQIVTQSEEQASTEVLAEQ
jgi:hypothetical protein